MYLFAFALRFDTIIRGHIFAYTGAFTGGPASIAATAVPSTLQVASTATGAGFQTLGVSSIGGANINASSWAYANFKTGKLANSQKIGVWVAQVLLNARANDGFQGYKFYTFPQYPTTNPGNPTPIAGWRSDVPTSNATWANDVQPTAKANPGQSSYTATVRLDSGNVTTTSKQQYVLYPQLASVTPYTILKGADYIIGAGAGLIKTGVNNTKGGPPPVTSKAYQTALDEVRSKGSDQLWHKDPISLVNSQTVSTRSADETSQAWFWRSGPGTSGLPGLFSTIALTLLPKLKPTATVYDHANLFALLHTAMFDASIAAWANKFNFLHWRPETALRPWQWGVADPAYGGNVLFTATGDTNSTATPGWQSLVNAPPYPEYPSAHATLCGAAAQVLIKFFGVDTVTGGFTVTSEDIIAGPQSVAAAANLDANVPGTIYTYDSTTGLFYSTSSTVGNTGARTYSKISDLANECSNSRVVAGVNFRFSVDDGQALGAAIGAKVYSAYPGNFTTVANNALTASLYNVALPFSSSSIAYPPATASGASARGGVLALYSALLAATAALLAIFLG